MADGPTTTAPSNSDQSGTSDDLNSLDAPKQAAIERYETDAGTSALSIRSLDDIKRISTIFIGSGMFKGDKTLTQNQQLYQAGVKIIAGVEFGIQPFAAMRGINIINGNAEMSANLMAAKVKKHPKYDYRVDKWDKESCVISFYEIPYPGAGRAEWEKLGESSFDDEDAKTAQLAGGQNWRKFARNMYFARAMSNGVRIYTPDVFYGAPVYVEGEISGEFNDKVEPSREVEADQVEKVPDTKASDEPQEAEIIESEVQEAPAEEPSDAAVGNVSKHLFALNLPDHRVRQLIRETTGKPFLRNCTEEDLVTLAERIDAIESGEDPLPDDWYEVAVTEKTK